MEVDSPNFSNAAILKQMMLHLHDYYFFITRARGPAHHVDQLTKESRELTRTTQQMKSSL